MNNKKNLFSAIIFQFIHILYGLIVPRIILGCFGSDINGLVSSITQFLSFISLLEGGLGAVVLAELYVPIENHDVKRINNILASCQRFFVRLSIIFAAYTVVLSVIYAYTIKDQYNFIFISSLVWTLSLTTIAQYMFSITYRLYIQANQKLYIIQRISSLTMIVNIIVAIVVAKLFPEIRLLKLASSTAFFIQPFLFRHFVDPEFRNYRRNGDREYTLKNRWSGFAQNLAHFINLNTDIIVITVFSTFTNVSIYSVYILAINAIKTTISTLTNSYQSALGKYIAQNDTVVLKKNFKRFCVLTWGISLILFCTCLLLINPFVQIYTNNVHDANYYQPIFAMIICLANLIYCMREPFRLLILAAGKFRETNFGSFMEAILNIGISILLVNWLGLVGVAIGTLVAISYRAIYFIYYLKTNIIEINIKEYYRHIITALLIVGINLVIYFFVGFSISNFIYFCIYGIVVVFIECLIVASLFFGSHQTIDIIRSLFKK